MILDVRRDTHAFFWRKCVHVYYALDTSRLHTYVFTNATNPIQHVNTSEPTTKHPFPLVISSGSRSPPRNGPWRRLSTAFRGRQSWYCRHSIPATFEQSVTQILQERTADQTVPPALPVSRMRPTHVLHVLTTPLTEC